MVRTSVSPTKNNVLVLPLPEQYRRKDIEVLIYAKDELQVTQEPEVVQKKRVTMADFIGTVSKADAEKLRLHSENARKEWDRDF